MTGRSCLTRFVMRSVVGRVNHTGNHVNWSGRKCITGVEPEPYYVFDGELFCRRDPQNKFWTSLGYAPKPVTDWDRFWFHFYNGMIMKYGFINSLCFAVRWHFKGKRKK